MMETESALIVPAPAVEPVVGPHRGLYDPAASGGIPAHITVLYPFKPPDTIDRSMLDELREIFAGVVSFSFSLTSVAQFPGVVYLVPKPDEPFVRLTAAIATRWPETPPYEGLYEQIVPHLTVAHTRDVATVGELRNDIEPSLPLECRATEAWLLTSRQHQWQVRERFPFAASQT
jgi:2'-5' RNA ligase